MPAAQRTGQPREQASPRSQQQPRPLHFTVLHTCQGLLIGDLHTVLEKCAFDPSSNIISGLSIARPTSQSILFDWVIHKILHNTCNFRFVKLYVKFGRVKNCQEGNQEILFRYCLSWYNNVRLSPQFKVKLSVCLKRRETSIICAGRQIA